MLLTLFRLIMIVSLLISAVRVEVNSEKLSLIPSEENEAAAQSHRQSGATLLKEDRKSAYDEDKDLAQRRESYKESGYSSDRDTRIRRGSVNSAENRLARSGNRVLAHKMAKDVLKSPKTQDTIRKLSRVSSPKGSLRAGVKVPGVTKGGSRLVGEKRHHGARHRGRRKKKKKRHHRKLRKQQPGLLKRGSSKRTSDSKKDINAFAKGSHGRGHSMIKHNPVVLADKSRDKSPSLRSSSNVTAVNVDDDDDYVDFSSPKYTETTVRLTESKRLEKPGKLHESERMTERLMRTTTKDPSKKSPGDQGIEYSDYYSDDEVLQDIAANKIPIQLAVSKNPNDRFARQTHNFSPHRDSDLIDRNLQHYYSDYDTRRKGLEYRDDTVNSLHNFQNYPTIDRLPTLNRNSRHFSADDPSFRYATNYEPLEYRDENFDPSYPANMAALPEQLERNSLPVQQNDLDASDLGKLDSEIQQPAVESQNPDQFNYQSQYETVPEHLQTSNEPQSLNVNEALEPRLPQFQSLNSYQQVDTNLPETGTFDRSMMNQPRIDNTGILNPKEEDTEVRTQSSYTPIQLYANQEEQQKEQQNEQALKNFLIAQSKYSSPAVSVPNAMDQPLGKVLESLGINVNSGPTNLNQNPNFDENINRQVLPYSNTFDQPMEHAISPNYLKRKPNEDLTGYYENGNARGLEYQTLKGINNAREGNFRRQSIQNGGYNDNTVTHLDDDENPARNINISIAMHDTKEVANQILDTIMEELEELKEDKSRDNKKEGSWSTAQAGVKLDMRVVNRTIIVTLSDLASPRLHESLLNGTWNVSGHVPFKRGSPFTLIATNNNTNSIAVFVGACRVCQGIDTIAGVWSVARQPNDCKDFQVSTSVFNDIFRKTRWSSLKEKQGSNTTDNSTIKHKKRKS